MLDPRIRARASRHAVGGLLALLACLSACRSAPPLPSIPPPTPTATPAPLTTTTAAGDLVRIAPGQISFDDDLPAPSLAAAIERTLEALLRRPAAETLRVADASCTIGELRTALDELREAAGRDDPATVKRILAERWTAFRSLGRPDGLLLTGYYEPVVEGRRGPTGAFVHPLYRRPLDLVDAALGDFAPLWAGQSIAGRLDGQRLVPYFSRRDIDGGRVLDGRGLELVWLDDPVARFFLQVQGSGVVRLEAGREMRVGYAASNGRSYTSIGRILVGEGVLGGELASAPAIQRWLRDHPERRDEILFRNERYIFFRELADGPIGSLGATLTAGRSIAVDPRNYPLGVLAFVESELPAVDPSGRIAGQTPLHRLVLTQDGGAAISGPGRVDLFFGTGDRAGLEAGSVSARGTIHFLIPVCTAIPSRPPNPAAAP